MEGKIETSQVMKYFVRVEQQGSYFTIPFSMPESIETFTLRYSYDRMQREELSLENGVFRSKTKVNTIDLGLIAPDGTQAGASGSDKLEVSLSETSATPGYQPRTLTAGVWGILVGAYKVAPPGVEVTYELTFVPKQQRLLKGDIHMHTLASDGVLSAAELGTVAKRHGLDFIAITDHNQMLSHQALPQIPGLTIIPGVEWTHYQGHSNFLGVDQPYDQPFFTNTPEEALSRFNSARERGALIVIDHPQDENCPFKFDLNVIPFDCFEIWNGPMRESNLRAVGMWQAMLSAGRKVSAVGGSDFHRSELFIYPGGPTTCVYTYSNSERDILNALRQGRGFVTYAQNGPLLEMNAGAGELGDTVRLADAQEIQIKAARLVTGDTLQVITASGVDGRWQAPASGEMEVSYRMTAPGFARVEVLRHFLPGIPALPALIGNPIYFER